MATPEQEIAALLGMPPGAQPPAHPEQPPPPPARKEARRPAQDTPSMPRGVLNKAAAGILWLAGAWLTYGIIVALRPGIGTLEAAGVALLGQGILTLIEIRGLRRRRWGLAIPALALDTLINAGGLWIISGALANTDVWKMLTEAFNLEGGMHPLIRLAIVIVIGYTLARIPEWLYDLE